MDFGFTEDEEALRKEVAEFAQKELPPWWEGFPALEEYGIKEGWEVTRQLAKKLADRGWLVMTWPQEYGGRGNSNMEQFIYNEERAYHRMPGICTGELGGVGPSLMLFGTEEQKRRYLPKIASGEGFWCLAYSEPEAGSDLAALQCRATKDGDDYIINGQKVWTSEAQGCDGCFMAARTDPHAPKHKGLSLFLLDIDTPGITVRPLMTLSGCYEFCEIFFDDVRVPRSSLLGEENRGWQCLMAALDAERSYSIAFVASAKRMLDDLVEYVKETKRGGQAMAEDPLIRQKLAELAIECEVGRLICYRVAWMLDKGLSASYETSLAKNFGCELGQKVANVGMQLMGLYCQLEPGSKWGRLKGAIEHFYLSLVGATLYAGTSEVNRNVIAIKGLDLPRG